MAEIGQKTDFTLKFIIVGNAVVGKPNNSYRFSKGLFAEEYKATVGMDFAFKNITVRDKNIKIQIWDTAGQECFKSISRGYYKSSVCGLIVYDITSRESFNNVSTWVEECQNNGPRTITLVLVGNKSDLEENRLVKYEEGEELANRYNMKFYETSAFNGNNIDKLFYDTTEIILTNMDNDYYDLTNDECGITFISRKAIMASKKPKKRFC